jgi:hypothetical protein
LSLYQLSCGAWDVANNAQRTGLEQLPRPEYMPTLAMCHPQACTSTEAPEAAAPTAHLAPAAAKSSGPFQAAARGSAAVPTAALARQQVAARKTKTTDATQRNAAARMQRRVASSANNKRDKTAAEALIEDAARLEAARHGWIAKRQADQNRLRREAYRNAEREAEREAALNRLKREAAAAQQKEEAAKARLQGDMKAAAEAVATAMAKKSQKDAATRQGTGAVALVSHLACPSILCQSISATDPNVLVPACS